MDNTAILFNKNAYKFVTLCGRLDRWRIFKNNVDCLSTTTVLLYYPLLLPIRSTCTLSCTLINVLVKQQCLLKANRILTPNDTWVSHEQGGSQKLARSWQDLRQNLAHRESVVLRAVFSRSAAERAAGCAQLSEASNLGPPSAKELGHSRAYGK